MLERQSEPVTVTVQEAHRLYGFSRSEIYRRLVAGDFRARKSGTRTLIEAQSIRDYIGRLPEAKFTSRAA